MKKNMFPKLILFSSLLFTGTLYAKSCSSLLTREYFRMSAKLARAQSKGDPFTQIFLRRKVNSLKDTKDLMKELSTGREGQILHDLLLGVDTRKISKKNARKIVFAVYNNNGFCFVPKQPLPGGEKITWLSLEDLTEGLESGYLQKALEAWRLR